MWVRVALEDLKLWWSEPQSTSRGQCCRRPLFCLIISSDLAKILLYKIELVNCAVRIIPLLTKKNLLDS